MVVGEVAERADVVVIGGGPGGYVAALRCADLARKRNESRRVVLIERQAVGGTCLNVGCIPSKVLIHAADVAALAAKSASWGVTLTAVIDANKLQEHTAGVVAQLTGGVQGLLDAAGVEVWTAEARFSRRDRLAVVAGPSVKHLEFENCIIATGSRPTPLAVLPLDGDRIVDSTGALAFQSVPESLVVVGGGYIGVELGTAYAKLGANVTIIEAADRLLPAMDKHLGRQVQRRLKELGVAVHTSTTVGGPNEPLLAEAEKIVVAVGRTPNTDDLGLDVAGVTTTNSGLVDVAPNRQAAPNIYAIGDITAGPALAHKATAEAEVAARTISGEAAEFNPAAIPEVVFSDPEVASVGFTPSAAAEAGIQAKSFRFPFSAGSRSRTLDDTAGFVQLVADESGTLIGAQMAGVGVAELIAEATLGIEMSATVEDLAATIHPHPTMSEALAEAAFGLDGRPLHVPG